jgi:hypothetical protein
MTHNQLVVYYLGQMTLRQLFTRITNEAIHDYSEKGLSFAERSALSLGSKFLPSPPCLSLLELSSAVQRFENTVRWKYIFRHVFLSEETEAANIRFRVPSNRTPKPAAVIIETYLTNIREHVMQSHLKPCILPSNMSHNQRQGLNTLRQRNDIVVKLADKNLGLVAVNTEWYKSQALAHLNATCLVNAEQQQAYQRIQSNDPPTHTAPQYSIRQCANSLQQSPAHASPADFT